MPSSPPTTETAAVQDACSPVCDVLRKPKRKKKMRGWHRMLGMLTAIPLLWVLVTGVLLNHADDFGLNESKVTNPTVLEWYGMAPKSLPYEVKAGKHSVVEWDGVVFYNEQAVELTGEFLGAAPDGDGCVIVSSEEVLRMAVDGELVEKLDELSLPEIPLAGVGVSNGKTYLANKDGWHEPDADWIECLPNNDVVAVPVVKEVVTDEALNERLLEKWVGEGLPMSRVILDLHSGNFLGSWAKYFYDFVALCAIVLIGSGVILHYRTSKRNRKQG